MVSSDERCNGSPDSKQCLVSSDERCNRLPYSEQCLVSSDERCNRLPDPKQCLVSSDERCNRLPDSKQCLVSSRRMFATPVQVKTVVCLMFTVSFCLIYIYKQVVKHYKNHNKKLTLQYHFNYKSQQKPNTKTD